MDSHKKKEFRHYDHYVPRLVNRSTPSLSVAGSIDKLVGPPVTEDKCVTEASRSGSLDEKLRALKQYRGARGLCDHYAKKWSYGHKCASSV
jgi:hypothetical protein